MKNKTLIKEINDELRKQKIGRFNTVKKKSVFTI
jgi:hypothetical protein